MSNRASKPEPLQLCAHLLFRAAHTSYNSGMRSIFIQPPLELRLEVPGDSFMQGQEVPCTFSVKNHGSSPVLLERPTLLLSLGQFKKVKAKDQNAFETLTVGEVERGSEVPAGGELSFRHRFTLDRNSPITDKSVSPFILFGVSSDPATLGQLLLTVAPHPEIRSVFDSLTTVFSFVNKGETWKAGETIAKLKAPDAKRFSMLEELNLSCKFDGDALLLTYSFTVKKFENVMVKVAVKRGKAEVSQRWERSDYIFGDGFVRQEFVEKMVDQALSVVASGF